MPTKHIRGNPSVGKLMEPRVLSQSHPTAVSVFSLEEDRIPRLVEVVVVERDMLWTGPRLYFSLSLWLVHEPCFVWTIAAVWEPSTGSYLTTVIATRLDWLVSGGRRMISRTHVNHFGTALCSRQGMHVNAGEDLVRLERSNKTLQNLSLLYAYKADLLL